jgi:alpha-1,6-mannosyltransferase
VGEGPETEEIKRYSATHLGVKYLGHFDSHRELARVYASSDVFIMPGRNETFGMATIEALACGLPVVGMAEGGSRDLITPEVGALARSGDAQDLATKISIVASWNRDSIRECCHSFAATRYSWEKVLMRYFEIYQNLISGIEFVRAKSA